MASPKGRILFSDDEKSESSEKSYKPKILFTNDESPENVESTGWSGVGQDILHKGGQFIAGIPNALRALPGEISGAGQQLSQQPGRFGQNLLAGLAEHGHKIASAPGELRDYLIKKQLASQESPSFRFPESVLSKEFNYPEAIGIEGSQPGDELIRGIPGMIAAPGEIAALRKVPGLRSGSRHAKKLEKTIDEIENAKASHSQFLGQGQEHGSRAAQELTKAIEGEINPETGKMEGGLRRKVGSQYDKLSRDMAKENVVLQSAPDLRAIQKEIMKLGKGVSGEEKENLMKVLTAADSKKNVNGADALASYRELKHQKGQAFKNAYAAGENTSPKAREEWIKKGEQLDALEKRMKKLISEQIGDTYLDKLKKIDKDYATQIAPLYKNPMYQEMLKHGQTSKNMMKALHGTTPGNETLRTIVKNNPEMQRLIVGQKFAAKPEELVKAGEILEPYKGMNKNIARIISEQGKIKNLQETKIPELREAVKKSQNINLVRRGALAGALGTAGGGAGLLALETALGRDWKKDAPLLASILTLKNSVTRKR